MSEGRYRDTFLRILVRKMHRANDPTPTASRSLSASYGLTSADVHQPGRNQGVEAEGGRVNSEWPAPPPGAFDEACEYFFAPMPMLVTRDPTVGAVVYGGA